MSLTIPQEYAAFIRDSVASGRFRSEDEPVAEALRLLHRHKKQRAALRADLQVGIDALDAGDVSELDAEDTSDAGKNASSLKAPNDLAVPAAQKQKSRRQQPTCRRVRKQKVYWIFCSDCTSDTSSQIA